MRSIKFISFLLLVSSSAVFISYYDKSNKMDLEPPATEGQTCCSKDTGGCIFFEYEGKSYHFEAPTLKIWIDTLGGASVFLPDSVMFYERNIVIEESLDDNQDILVAINDVKDPSKE